MRIPSTKDLTVFLFFIAPALSFSQLNMTLQDSVTYTIGVNDVCGWSSPDGKEYALVGLQNAVAIVDVDSDTLKEVAVIQTVYNTWKDINTYGHYAYVSTEATVGLLIIDLQYLPDSVKTYVWEDYLPAGDTLRPFRSAHTLWTDEYGILYLNGSNLNSGGVIMLDVASSPTDPVFLGYAPPVYSHDCYTRDSMIYSAEIFAGDLSIYDAHDPQNIFLVGRVKTPNEFTHNAWLSDNSQFMFTTDERNNSYVTSYDISDPGNIIELDRYRQASTEGSANIVHNVYVWKEDWLLVAYYANGTVIVDASRPDNLVEVGNFDTWAGSDGGFEGVWGTYPWLPSGKVLSSDRNSGLYVFEPTYVRACFLEGIVIDSLTSLPIEGALVTIISNEVVLPNSTKFNGGFKMGKAVPGQFNVLVEKPGYHPENKALNFVNGEVLTPTIKLRPIITHQIGGKVFFSAGGSVPFAKVALSGYDGLYEITCDENGEFLLPAVFDGTYELQSGVWGHTYETIIELHEPLSLTIILSPGYKDDFDVDLGWTVEIQATSGIWGRGLPTKQLLFLTYECASDGDSPNDIGGFAYTTGLSASEDVLDNEVSGGTTWLVSPAMDLTQMNNPEISFDYWLCEFPPNQYTGLNAWISNGVDTFLLDSFRNVNISGSWISKTYSELPIGSSMDQVKLMISASDTTSGQSDYIVKAHFDNFKVQGDGLSSIEPHSKSEYFIVYPTPAKDGTLYVKRLTNFEMGTTIFAFYDLQGRLLSTSIGDGDQDVTGLEYQLADGMYFLHWQSANGISGVEKVIIKNKG